MDALSLAESVKYITAAGVTITYWDHFLTIGDELKYIWKRPFAEVKVLYIVCRYTQTATFIFISFGINGLLRAESDDFCKATVLVYVLFSPWVCMIVDYMLLVRLYSLWDYRKRVLYILRVVFALCWILTTIGIIVITVPNFRSITFNGRILHICIITVPRYRSILWAPGMVFQFFVLLLTIWNAADRPRPIHVKILSDLIRDGIAANLAIFLLRLCCFALSIPSDTSFFVAGSMLETVFSVTVVSRLVLRVEEMLANNLRSDIVVHVPPMGEGLRSHDFSGVSVITCD